MEELATQTGPTRRERLWRWGRTHLWQAATAVFTVNAGLVWALWIGGVDPQLAELQLPDLSWLEKVLTPDWITAIATVGALVAAGMAASVAYGQLSELRRESHERAQERISRHARAVFFRVEKPLIDSGNRIVRNGRLILYNTGTEPITDLTLQHWYGDFDMNSGSMNFKKLLIPTGIHGEEMNDDDFSLLMEAVLRYSDADQTKQFRYWSHNSVTSFNLNLIFTDSTGRTWLKREDTTMRQILSKRAGAHDLPYRPLEGWNAHMDSFYK